MADTLFTRSGESEGKTKVWSFMKTLMNENNHRSSSQPLLIHTDNAPA